MSQAYYKNSIADFLSEPNESIIGKLNLGSTQFASAWTRTTTSWDESINIFKKSFGVLITQYEKAKKWTIFLEYEIPRLLSRVDAIIIAEDLIFVIEYKDDRKEYKLEDIHQAEDYALDLADFHLESRNKTIIPILLATNAKSLSLQINVETHNQVKSIVKANKENFYNCLLQIFEKYHVLNSKSINPVQWDASKYSPTPTIIQAAQAIFSGHNVEAITQNGAENLSSTVGYLIDVIAKAKKEQKKVACFVTGVPGAGKTLVGLSIIHKEDFIETKDINAAYFSGNGPLIKVLRVALTKDDLQKNKINSPQIKYNKNDSGRKIESKIQNLHSFIKDGIKDKNTPFENVVVFDEAQRCWSADHFYNKSVRNNSGRNSNKDNIEPQRKSEAEILFEIMDRHKDWAVIIALVGHGQEINTGEAGIEEWKRALTTQYKNWEIHLAPQFADEIFTANPSVQSRLHIDTALNLSVSQRSFKATNLNEWVNALINNRAHEATEIYKMIQTSYPITITRDIEEAKNWLRHHRQGSKRIGMIASSGALRLRPFGINTKEEVDEPIWFLNDETDVRSSHYLEVVATEFGIQGLEIDWCCVCWDADLRRETNNWEYKKFKGTNWHKVNKDSDKQYLLNKYRVLLTRAREGMVIWVPEGDIKDPTRLPEFYDPIFKYLVDCGLTILPSHLQQ